MQLSTLMKFGGLAFDVVQDDKIKELAGMIHKGARRRGFFGELGQAGGHGTSSSGPAAEGAHPIPFAPKEEKAEAPKKEKPAGIHLPPQVGFPTGSFGKYMNVDNAQKMKKWAAEIGQHLITK